MIMIKNEVIIQGGLGNQIFGLFYAYKLLLKYENQVSLNLGSYSRHKRVDRSFLLKDFYPQLEDEFKINSTIISTFIYYYSKLFEKIFIKQKKYRLPGDNIFSINYWPNRYIHNGYFQKINNSVLDNKSINLLKKNYFHNLTKMKYNYLAIHIRRGDYLNKNSLMHGLIQEKYLFEEAKNQLKENNFDGITIFTDSPNLVDIGIFKLLNKNINIDIGGCPIQVLKRMANHKALIASNSSFSLWAGILGDVKNFSIPYYWMKNVKSSILGLRNIKRYKCSIE